MSPIQPTSRVRFRRFREDSELRRMVQAMIASNSLAAFTAEVSRNAGLTQARAPVTSPGSTEAPRSAVPAQRKLEAVPPQPSSPLPRGTLLDLRV